MNVQHAPDIELDVAACLAQIDRFSTRPLHVLKVMPHLANSPEVRSTLIPLLKHPYLVVRLMAAEALARVDDPEGLLHLVYNVLSFHPQLGVEQTAGYHNLPKIARHALFPFMSCIPEEGLELLLAELSVPGGNPVHDLLAALPTEIIVPRLRHLPRGAKNANAAISYILARHGFQDGKSVLLRMLHSHLDSKVELELGIVGLSHIPDTQILSDLEALTDPEYEICAGSQYVKWWLPRLATERLMFASALYQRDRQAMERAFRKFFTRAFAGTQLLYFGGRWTRSTDGDGSVCDLLFEFADEPIRQNLAATQSKALASLDIDQLSSKEFASTFALGIPSVDKAGELYRPAIDISLERSDFEHAAVRWIKQPEAHLVGSCFSSWTRVFDSGFNPRS